MPSKPPAQSGHVRVLELLSAASAPGLTPPAIAAALSISESMVHAYLRRLSRSGAAVQVGRETAPNGRPGFTLWLAKENA